MTSSMSCNGVVHFTNRNTTLLIFLHVLWVVLVFTFTRNVCACVFVFFLSLLSYSWKRKWNVWSTSFVVMEPIRDVWRKRKSRPQVWTRLKASSFDFIQRSKVTLAYTYIFKRHRVMQNLRHDNLGWIRDESAAFSLLPMHVSSTERFLFFETLRWWNHHCLARVATSQMSSVTNLPTYLHCVKPFCAPPSRTVWTC